MHLLRLYSKLKYIEFSFFSVMYLSELISLLSSYDLRHFTGGTQVVSAVDSTKPFLR
jgi:hypothetical protein